MQDVQTGFCPGSANLPISLATAYLDSVPFLAVTGNVPTSQFNRGAFQEMYRQNQADFPSTVRSICKRVFQPTRGEMVPLDTVEALDPVDIWHTVETVHVNVLLIVGDDVAGQIAHGDHRIMGVMIESHLKAGNQPVVEGQELTYGLSITDACLSWDDTVPLLKKLAQAVQKRRTVDTNRSLNA